MGEGEVGWGVSEAQEHREALSSQIRPSIEHHQTVEEAAASPHKVSKRLTPQA